MNKNKDSTLSPGVISTCEEDRQLAIISPDTSDKSKSSSENHEVDWLSVDGVNNAHH